MSSTTPLTPSEYFDQKIQRISHALYLITDSMDENEPLKKSIRDSALSLIERLSFDTVNQPHGIKDEFAPLIRQTMTFLSLARTMTYISDMNSSIMLEEMRKLLERLEKNEFEKKDTFADDYFIVPPPQTSSRTSRQHVFGTITPFLEEKRVVYNDTESSKRQDATDVNDKKADLKTYSHISSAKTTVKTPVTARPKKTSVSSTSSRRQQILNLFKNGVVSITIHDVEKALEGVSIKTMQRDLATMVEEGVLLKTGEKRWSEYHLPKETI